MTDMRHRPRESPVKPSTGLSSARFGARRNSHGVHQDADPSLFLKASFIAGKRLETIQTPAAGERTGESGKETLPVRAGRGLGHLTMADRAPFFPTLPGVTLPGTRNQPWRRYVPHGSEQTMAVSAPGLCRAGCLNI